MKKINGCCLCIILFFVGCSKTEPKSYDYWNNLVNQKREAISTLTQSVSCSNIENFEIVKKGSYYLVHPTVRESFEKLYAELEQLEREKNIASTREGLIGDGPLMIPNHPVEKICDNGKPKLRYAKDLSIAKIIAELPVRYEEIKSFYKDESCVDPNQWQGHNILINCNVEPVVVHKTIRKVEILTKIDIYNQMMIIKLQHEKPNCTIAVSFQKLFEKKAVRCEDGKPVAND